MFWIERHNIIYILAPETHCQNATYLSKSKIGDKINLNLNLVDKSFTINKWTRYNVYNSKSEKYEKSEAIHYLSYEIIIALAQHQKKHQQKLIPHSFRNK